MKNNNKRLVDSDVGVILPVIDLERAKAFYRDTLGLRETELPGDEAAMFQSGQGTALYLYRRDTPTQADHTVAGWMVPELEPVLQVLRDRGLEFEQYDSPDIQTDDGGVAVSVSGEFKSAWFKDPEGNILAITESP